MLALAALCILCSPILAEIDRTPPGIGVDEKLGSQVPLDLPFTDEAGRTVKLNSFFKDDRRPVLLVPGYYSCPRLCSLVFNGVRDGVAATRNKNLVPGKDYTILSVSFNPTEGPDLAGAKGRNYRTSFQDGEIVPEGWVFLTGSPASINRLMEVIGYRYRQDGEEFSHPAAAVFLAPDGKISRYLYGFNHRPHDFRLALVEAARGRIGQTFDHVLLYCFRYDPQKGQYAPYAWAFLRIGGALTALTLAALIFFMLFYRRSPANNA